MGKGTAAKKKEMLQNKLLEVQLNKKIDEAYLMGLNYGVKQGVFETINLALWVMRTKQNYGHKRLNAFLVELDYLSECVSEGRLSLDDIKQALDEEVNIRVGLIEK